MPTDIVIPALGESVTSGVIATWRKSDGEHVERDETVLDLETDKITLELPSPASGVLKRKAAEGDTVEVGAVVGLIDESGAGAKPSGAKASIPASVGAKKEPEPPKRADATATKPAPAPAHSTPVKTPERHDDDVRVTPLARKIAQEKNVDLSRVPGTGASGRVREQDVLAYIQTHTPGSGTSTGNAAAPRPSGESAAPPKAAPITGAPLPGAGAFTRETRRERMSPLRQRIATRLVEAQHTAAMLTTFNECDMTNVMALRSRHKEQFEKAHGVGLGFMSFFIKASVSALRAFPLVNAQIVKGEQGPEILRHDYCDVAVAVGTPKGLVVPVLRNCESLSFAQIEQGIKDLATRARDGKLTLEELQGATFTISNGGVYGSMMSTPILNPPQSGILGMHNIVRRPVEHPDKPGSGEVVVRPMMYLALSYDHRVVDGAEAVGFLVHVKKCVENPERLLLDL